ncbi:hypothetical protein FRB91_000643 [Serendipita sp. 411]|nr:hypothetical protein FRC15_011898 [Serendipita sp. 397]KAG8828538.1 hypothetical protein FRC19_003877 [Serendipita sp. 401]KAG8830121.1 hypothetical protein FRC18_008618 [Serendipita sp. 400]KAG8856544.1 hypothetical protein FRB91_000643 [Serendipita sp. 411]KAG9058592.1 hypothetical protein FS842_008014 [Serendipita sp. 407]
MERTPTSSRPLTPTSPIRSETNASEHSLQYDDDLTNALAALRNFSSRATTPLELRCCCGKEDCESLQEWKEVVNKLEKELVLSAEVGQALLHRHDAFVRSQDSLRATADRNAQLYSDSRERVAALNTANNQLVARMSLLVKENTAIERRLTQAMLNLEVADASNRTLLHEIQETRGTITKLSTQNMKSVGWEAKLYSLQQERDDLREERKSEAARARTAEAKAAALSEKCARLQAEIYNLKEEKENARRSKSDFSEEIIRDARLRLDALHVALSDMPKSEDAEMTRILESLVSENEALKHDNAELQNLLTDCREDVRELREEVEEKRATAPIGDSRLDESHPFPSRLDGFSRHNKRESWASTSSAPVSVTSPRNEGFLSPRLPIKRARTPSYSLQMGRRSIIARKSPSEVGEEKITTDPLSGNETDPHRTLHSPAPSSRRTSISRHSYTASTYSIEVDSSNQNDAGSSSPPKGKKKQLLLLTRSRGVQTDPINILPISPRPPSLLDEHTPSGTHSETSSLQEGKTSQFSLLLDKINALFHRIIQADIRTLTNRLKRQHLAGADVGHLSRTTISSILNEVSALRNQFRGILDDERAAVVISRKEFRALLKTYSELFQEIGSLRASVNEVVLNPSVGEKLREEALAEDAPSKTAAKPAGGLGGWIAPLSKLWAVSSAEAIEKPGAAGASTAALARAGSSRNRLQPPKIAPKLAPAVSASTTTVNVEFTNAGIRRAISTTPGQAALPTTTQMVSSSPLGPSRPQLKGIFAGSSATPSSSSSRTMTLDRTPPAWSSGGTLRASQARTQGVNLTKDDRNSNQDFRRMSRVVDAMVDQNAIDDEEDDELPSDLLQRTLRPRGLSDSSIHSSLIPHGPPVNRLVTPAGLALSPTVESANARGRSGTLNTSITSWLDRDAVLQSLSRKMQGFRFGTGSDLISSKPLPPADDGGLSPNALGTPAAMSSSLGGTPTASRSPLPASPPKPIPERLISPNHLGRGNRSRSPTSRTPYNGSNSPKMSHRRTGSLHRQAQA